MLSNAATSVLPARVLANIEKQLLRAGNPMTINAYVVFWMLSVGLLSGFILISFVVVWGTIGVQQAGAVLLFGVFGWMLPSTWLKVRV